MSTPTSPMDELLRFVDLGGIPDEKQRQALVSEVRRLRQNEADFRQRVQYLNDECIRIDAERDALRAAIQTVERLADEYEQAGKLTDALFIRTRLAAAGVDREDTEPAHDCRNAHGVIERVPGTAEQCEKHPRVGDTGQANEPQRTPEEVQAALDWLNSGDDDETVGEFRARRAGQVVPTVIESCVPSGCQCSCHRSRVPVSHSVACCSGRPGPVGQETTGEQQ